MGAMPAASPNELLWAPTSPEKTNTYRFLQHINARFSPSPPLTTYEELHRWSTANRGEFWSELWDFAGIVGTKGAAPYIDPAARPSDNPAWFPGASVSWAENQLRWAHERPDDIAVIQTREPSDAWDTTPRRTTQKELYDLVAACQAGLVSAGVQKGDRVGWWGGNCLEAVVVLLAVSACGAIFSSAAADFGVDGVIERLEQIRPKVLFVTDGVVYGGTARPLLPLLPRLLSDLKVPPQRIVVVQQLKDGVANLPDGLATSGSVESWGEFVQKDAKSVNFERMGFNDPQWILFSSGTTGRPKAIVHRVGGMLLDLVRENWLAGDMGRGDVYFYYTTPGWMMFQYLVSGLTTGATIVLYEGSPLKDPSLLWRMTDEFQVTHFGTSAKWIEQISKNYPAVGANHSLSSLRQILSTGSPLPHHLFDYVYEKIKKDLVLGSITGGSDICSVFAGRCTMLPVYRGEIQARMLGYALDTASAEPGPPGELICHHPFPTIPCGFWPLPGYGFPEGDVQKAQDRFQESYFKDAQGTWYHGDYVQITPSKSGNGGGLIMLGRSDGVLNPGGIRFGPTDIYSVLENDEYSALGIEETLVVGLMVEGGADEKVILFVKMKPTHASGLDEALVKKIKTSIRLARSARHVPAKIVQVADIPVTLTGKRVEVPIRKVINGAKVESINPATLRNPECLAEYVTLGEKMRQEEGM